MEKFWHKGSDKYYRKYNAIDQLSGLGNYILSKANKYYGIWRKLTRLIFNVIIVSSCFMLGYYYGIEEVSKGVQMTWGIAGYMSLSNFLP